MDLLERFEQHIGEEAWFRKGDTLLLALSGGADSVCLLLLLCALRAEYGWKLSALHLNHRIRGEEAERDEAYCRWLCEEKQVPLQTVREDVPAYAEETGLSLEEAGRQRRYQLLREEARRLQVDAVLTAHHLDDQSETVLMNLFRGSGLKGLAGMRAESRLGEDLRLIRPLLPFSKEELKTWLQAQEVAWCEDSTNSENEAARNGVRNTLLPEVEALFPAAARHIAAAAEKLRDADAYLDAQAQAFLEAESAGGADVLPRQALAAQPPVLRQRILERFLTAAGGVKDVTEAHYKAMDALLFGPSGKRLDLPGGRSLLCEQETLRLKKGPAPQATAFPAWEMRVFSYKPGMKVPRGDCTKWLDYDTISEGVCLRHRREGDHFFLPGGEKKSLQRVLIDQKVPAGLRDGLWLFADGSHVLWLIGYRVSAGAYVTEKTRTVLELKINGKESANGEASG